MAKATIRWFGQMLVGCWLAVALPSVAIMAQSAPAGGDGIKETTMRALTLNGLY
ncbi:hypothetical protein ACFQT0_07160 [Hymenobacter humi]|uniref:Uncharacterized protein n=1 Tax=Hymenobacter humi TaxID=1411620 RepID=A0ABW2U446_9BACT